MQLAIDHIDQKGTSSTSNIQLSKLAFIKHMAMAGQRHRFSPSKLLRMLGMLMHYQCYLRNFERNRNRFSEPPSHLSDPTEKNQFSNLAGRAIADFLSKRIDHSIFTVNYEAAMREKKIKIKGKRPDLIAFTNKSDCFAIESKGRSQSHPGDMAKHKDQSRTGPIKVNFSVACVTYNMYQSIKCNYHDPYNSNIPFDSELFATLTSKYYSVLEQFLQNDFGYSRIARNGEEFFEVDLFGRSMNKLLDGPNPSWPFFLIRMQDFYKPHLILPANISTLARSGLPPDTVPINQTGDSYPSETLEYIDNDRVGISLKIY